MLRHLRLPCAGLFLAATLGIVLAATTRVSGETWIVCGAVAIALAWVPSKQAWAVWAATVFVFAAQHASQSWQSPGARLAETVGVPFVSSAVELEIKEPPSPLGTTGTRWRARGLLRIIEESSSTVWTPVVVVWQGTDPPAYGDLVRTSGVIRRIAPPRNPGEFDAASWYRLSGIYSEVVVDANHGFEIAGNAANPFKVLALESRAQVERILSIGIAGTVESGVILGMTIGDTSETPSELVDAFREVGVFHLFSVSGLHVGMIAAMLWFALGIAGVERRKAALVLIPCVFFYALVTGWKPASVRAATMIALVASGLLFHRQPIPLNSLCAAGLILLGINTNELFNPGFQLSFTVVAAILIIAMPVYHRIEHWVAPDPFIPRQLLGKWRLRVWETARWAGGLVSVSLAAWIGSLPLTIAYFNLISLAAIPTNIVIVPLAFFTLALAAGSISVGWAVPFLADILNHANLAITKVIIGVVSAAAAVPGGHFYVAAPMPRDQVAAVTVMDFGSGGGTVIRTRNGVWLIDGGETYHGRTTLLRYLRSLGVNRLAGVVLTHGDARHLGGLAAITERIPIAQAWESGAPDRSSTRRNLRESLIKSGVIVHEAAPDDVIELADSVTLTVLFPVPGIDQAVADEKALILRLDANGQRILFLSDAGTFAETWLLANAGDMLQADVLAKGHPRDGDSGSAEFLRAVAPSLVVQAASARAQGGGVSPLLRVNCASIGIPLLVQNRTGAVILDVRRQGLFVSQFLAGEPTIEIDRSTNTE